MSHRTMLGFAIALLVATTLSGCTRDQIENSILGGAKNWCRQQTASCHVSSMKP